MGRTARGRADAGCAWQEGGLCPFRDRGGHVAKAEISAQPGNGVQGTPGNFLRAYLYKNLITETKFPIIVAATQQTFLKDIPGSLPKL